MSTLRVSAVKNRPRTPRGPGAGYSLLGRSAQSFPGGRALPRVPGPDGETGHKANGAPRAPWNFHSPIAAATLYTAPIRTDDVPALTDDFAPVDALIRRR